MAPSTPLPPFQHLLDAHARDLHRYLVAQVGPVDGADCFQDAVLAALRAYPDLRSAENLRGWLFTIARNKVRDHHRARARRPDAVDPLPDRVGDGPPPDPDPSLWVRVGGLPPKQRRAVALRFGLDLPYVEIGRALGCTEGAARQNVRAGLATLREELGR